MQLEALVETVRQHEEEKVRSKYRRPHLGRELVIDNGRTGSGKTERMIRMIREGLAQNPDLRVLILVPTHDLGRDVLCRLEAVAPDISVGLWLGWNAKGPDGKPYCEFIDLVHDTQSAGGDPKALCQSGKRRCPHADTCPIFQQRQPGNVPTVQIAAHAIIHHKMAEREKFDVVFIDEDPISTLILTNNWYPSRILEPGRPSADELEAAAKGMTGADLEAIRRQLSDAFYAAARHEDGRLLRASLPPLPELEALRGTYARMLQRPKPKAPLSKAEFSATRGWLKAIAEDERPWILAERMLEQLLHILCNSPEEEYMPGVYVHTCTEPPGPKDGDLIGHPIVRMDAAMPFYHLYKDPDLMVLLSATAQPDLYRHLFEEVHVDASPADPRPPHTRYHLVPRSASKTSLLGLGNEEPGPTELLHQLGDRIIAKAREHRDEARGLFDGYVVAQKEVRRQLEDYIAKAAPDLVTGYDKDERPEFYRLGFEHFNALSGIDRYKQVRWGVVIGRPQPRLQVLLPQAEAIAGRCLIPDAPVAFGFKRQERGKSWLLDRQTIEVAGEQIRICEATSENEILDDLLRATCHAEVLQADRTRSTRRAVEDPLDLYFVNTLNLGDLITYDSVIHLKQEKGWYHDMAELGIVPDLRSDKGLNPLVAAVLHDRFKGVRAVRDRRRKDKTRHGIDESQWTGTEGWPRTQRAELLLPGERYSSHVLVRADTPDDARDVIKQLIEDGRLPEGTETKVVRVRAERSDKGTKRRPGGRRPTRKE